MTSARHLPIGLRPATSSPSAPGNPTAGIGCWIRRRVPRQRRADARIARGATGVHAVGRVARRICRRLRSGDAQSCASARRHNGRRSKPGRTCSGSDQSRLQRADRVASVPLRPRSHRRHRHRCPLMPHQPLRRGDRQRRPDAWWLSRFPPVQGSWSTVGGEAGRLSRSSSFPSANTQFVSCSRAMSPRSRTSDCRLAIRSRPCRSGCSGSRRLAP